MALAFQFEAKSDLVWAEGLDQVLAEGLEENLGSEKAFWLDLTLAVKLDWVFVMGSGVVLDLEEMLGSEWGFLLDQKLGSTQAAGLAFQWVEQL